MTIQSFTGAGIILALLCLIFAVLMIVGLVPLNASSAGALVAGLAIARMLP